MKIIENDIERFENSVCASSWHREAVSVQSLSSLPFAAELGAVWEPRTPYCANDDIRNKANFLMRSFWAFCPNRMVIFISFELQWMNCTVNQCILYSQVCLNSTLALCSLYSHRIQFSDQHNGPQLHRKGPRKFPEIFSAQTENLREIRQGWTHPSLPRRAWTGKKGES